MCIFVKGLGFPIIFCLVLVISLAAGCWFDGGDDDDDDDDDFGGGGGGGGGDKPQEPCGEAFVFGEGIARHEEGAWVDSTPDIFSDWFLHDAAWATCDELIFVGRNNQSRSGVVLVRRESAYAKADLPQVGEDWDLLSIAVYDKTVFAVGGDWREGRGLILRRVDGEWEMLPSLPYVSANWWLTDLSLTGEDEGYAVGVDMDRGGPVLLQLHDGAWSVVNAPGTADISYQLYAVAMVDEKNGLLVGRNLEAGRGIVLWQTNGAWYFPDTPSLGLDWNLLDVVFLGDDQAFLVGHRFDTDSGLLIEFNKGPLSAMNPPSFEGAWSLSGLAEQDGEVLACGVDKERSEGIVLRYAGEKWEIEARLPFLVEQIIAD